MENIKFKQLEWEEDPRSGGIVAKATIFQKTSITFRINGTVGGILVLFDNYYIEDQGPMWRTTITTIKEGKDLAQKRFNEHCMEILDCILIE